MISDAGCREPVGSILSWGLILVRAAAPLRQCMDNVDVVRVRGRGLRHLGTPRSASIQLHIRCGATPDKMRRGIRCGTTRTGQDEKSYPRCGTCRGARMARTPCAHPGRLCQLMVWRWWSCVFDYGKKFKLGSSVNWGTGALLLFGPSLVGGARV